MASVRSLVVVTLVLSAGCTKTFQTSATQLNPMVLPSSENLRESEHLYIDVRDMDLPGSFKLRNTAYFAVISRDRLRFHVTLVHKWDEMTDIRNWDVRLEDDRGRVFYPERRERRADEFVTRMWDEERRSAIRNQWGDIVEVKQDGHRQRTHMVSVDLFKGEGDCVFYARDLFDRKVRRLTLVMSRDGVEYRFTWNFTQGT